MFDKIKAATGGAAKALGLDGTTVVANLEVQLQDRHAAVQVADERYSAALKAESRGEAGSGVSTARKALQAATEALADTQRALADARQDAAVEQDVRAEQSLFDAWAQCDTLQAAVEAEAAKVDQAAVALAEAFRALVARQTELVKVIPEASHDFKVRLGGADAFSATTARLKVLCPELFGHHTLAVNAPKVNEAIGELYRAIVLHHKRVA